MEPTPSPPSRSEAGHAGHVRIAVVDGDGRAVQAPDLDTLERVLADERTVCWVDLAEPSPDTLSRVAEILKLHPLVVESITERNQRAKLQQYDSVVHIVLFGLRYAGEVSQSEFDFVLGERCVLSVHEPDFDPHDAPQLRLGAAELLKRGPDYLLYSICDWLADGYFPVLDALAEEIDQLQDDVVERASPWSLQRLFVLKKELIALRKATSPAREIFNQLTNREVGIVARDHVVYFRDVYDHLIRVNDEVDNYRELIAGTLEVYLSTVNNNLSLIMKRLTGVTVILAGIGAVAGIFGMSEAGSAIAGGEAVGFWIVALGCVMAAVLAAVILRRIDWI